MTIELKGHSCPIFVDVVGGNEQKTMMVCTTDRLHARIEAPFFVLKTKASLQPILGVPGNDPGASYISRPRGRVDSRVFVSISQGHLQYRVEWMVEKCIYWFTTALTTYTVLKLSTFCYNVIQSFENFLLIPLTKCSPLTNL